MLNESLRQEGRGPVESAFGNYRRVVTDSSGEDLAFEGLKAAVDGAGGVQMSYARFWHGYHIVLRPLLLFFHYWAIRWVNALVFTACVVAVTALLSYRLGLGVSIALLAALAAVGIVTVPMCLEYSGDFYLALGGMAAVALGMNEKGDFSKDLETFFIVGALTSFFNFLTTPVLTLGMPLAVLLLGRMHSDEESAFGRQLLCFARNASAWAGGYLGCWLAKWIISSIVLKENILLDATRTIAYRVSGVEAGVNFDRMETLRRNVAMLFPLFGCSQPEGIDWSVVIAACVMPVVATFVFIVVLVRHMRTDGRALRVLGLLPVGALPFVWYLTVNNHSRVHFFWSYRILAVTVFTTIACLFYLFDPAYLSRVKANLDSYLRYRS